MPPDGGSDVGARRLFYVADPMCSWCWGFSPVIGEIAERSELPVDVIMGGLRPGTDTPMDEAAKNTIREHWEHVHEATGQPFDFSFFEREGFVYDTEPACRAVVTARGIDTDAALPFLARVHAAFYRDNRDVTSDDTLLALGSEAGLDRDDFTARFPSAERREVTRADFEVAARMGVRGFPTLLGYDGRSLVPLTAGYRPLAALGPVVERWAAG